MFEFRCLQYLHAPLFYLAAILFYMYLASTYFIPVPDSSLAPIFSKPLAWM